MREAIARAAFERGGDGRGDGFLEVCCFLRMLGGEDDRLMRLLQVEDLEKLAPQLVLDF